MELAIPIRYKKDIEVAVNLLKEEGCESVYLYGSLVTGDFHIESDIDLGVFGLCPRKYIRTCCKLDKLLENEYDLVDFDENIDMYNFLCSINEVFKIG